MPTYQKEVAEAIIKCRGREFDVTDDGIRPILVSTENAEFDQLMNWTPACELDGDDAPDPQIVPSLPFPFTANHLAAWMVHGGGYFVREQYGDWADGPDKEAMVKLGTQATKAKRVLKQAFAAYREAERVIGAYDTSYSEKIQALEEQFGLWPDDKEARQRIKQAHLDADEYEAERRRKMVNQLLKVSLVTDVDLRTGGQVLPDAPAQTAEAPAPVVAELDYSLLATPAELLDAFGKWGMDAAWFDDLNSRQWLLEARRKKGQGQRGHVIEPLFCPFAVMTGLIEKVRKVNRLQPDTAWRTLAHKFPRVYAEFAEYDPRDLTGD